MLLDPGFENDLGWEYFGLGARSSTKAYAGTWSGKLPTRKSLFGVSSTSTIRSETFAVTVGTTYTITFYVNADAVTNTDVLLRLEFRRWNGTWATLASYSRTVGSGWVAKTIVYTPTVASGDRSIRFITVQTAGALAIDDWYIDEVDLAAPVEDMPVAVKLSERAVDAVVALYQAQLPGELSAIVTERADGITLEAPTNSDYYKREKVEVATGQTHIEVFDGGFEFENPYSDADAQRAVYVIPLTVRLTYSRRDGANADTMELRRRRFQAALFNVVNKNRHIDASDDAVQIGVVTGVPDPAIEREDGNVVKFQVSVNVLVRCEEIQ